MTTRLEFRYRNDAIRAAANLAADGIDYVVASTPCEYVVLTMADMRDWRPLNPADVVVFGKR